MRAHPWDLPLPSTEAPRHSLKVALLSLAGAFSQAVPGRFNSPLRVSTVLVEPYVMETRYNLTLEPTRPRYEGETPRPDVMTSPHNADIATFRSNLT